MPEKEGVVTAGAGDDAETKGFTPIESQEDLDRIIQRRLERERAKFSDYEELKAAKARLEEIEESEKSELQRVTEQLEAAKARAEELEKARVEAERSVLVERVAAAKGVPAKWLSGGTQEELEASADEWLEAAKSVAGPVGYVPTAGTGDPAVSVDEKQLAKERAKSFKL